jgi:methionyl-tRNA formyltransferase
MFLLRKPIKRFGSNQPKPAPKHWNILFFGSEKFSLPTLQLLTNRYESLRKPVGNLDVITTKQQYRDDWGDTPKRNIPHPIIDWTYMNG